MNTLQLVLAAVAAVLILGAVAVPAIAPVFILLLAPVGLLGFLSLLAPQGNEVNK